jgi:hypothetical protein
MLYLGIGQHKRQLTVNVRSEDGSVILKRQVIAGIDGGRGTWELLTSTGSGLG